MRAIGCIFIVLKDLVGDGRWGSRQIVISGKNHTASVNVH